MSNTNLQQNTIVLSHHSLVALGFKQEDVLLTQKSVQPHQQLFFIEMQISFHCGGKASLL